MPAFYIIIPLSKCLILSSLAFRWAYIKSLHPILVSFLLLFSIYSFVSLSPLEVVSRPPLDPTPFNFITTRLKRIQ